MTVYPCAGAAPAPLPPPAGPPPGMFPLPPPMGPPPGLPPGMLPPPARPPPDFAWQHALPPGEQQTLHIPSVSCVNDDCCSWMPLEVLIARSCCICSCYVAERASADRHTA